MVAVEDAAARRFLPGSPATVPSEVAMLRPSTDEVAKINADLQKFVETNTSADKDLLKKYESLLTVQMPPDNPCIRPAPSARGNRHTGLLQTATTGDFDIMFIGDSITDLLGAVNDGADNQDYPDIFTALRNLGLQLAPAKGVIDFFVVDHLERPTAN